ncbi:MAG: hypothetical protein R3B70_39390 [Polyangiaceae bacterium]
MMQPLRTRVPYRHDRLLRAATDESRGVARFRTQVPVRPARLVFQHDPAPRTKEVISWIRRHDPLRRGETDEDHRRAPYSPFVYRGEIAAHPEGEGDLEVRLWEEPSGRPLAAELPLEWFEGAALYKGMPFRLVTWMVEVPDGEPVARHRIESLHAGDDKDGVSS